MDTTAKLKDSLISRIKSSKNLDFLKAIQVLLDTSEQELYTLNESQKKAIEASRREIEQGETITNEEVLSNAKKWLAKK